MIPKAEETQYVELLGSQEFIRINHTTSYCSGSSKSLVIKRKEDGTISINCFRCGGWAVYNGSVRKVSRVKTDTGLTHRNISLPFDISHNFKDWSPKAYSWISRYGITEAEVKYHRIGYSEGLRRIVFPVFDHDGLAMMQTRKIYEEDPKPKYLTYRKRECTKIIRRESDILCLTEDYLSAIKCGRLIDSMPVFTTKLTTFQLSRIVGLYKKFIIWFDDDNPIVKKNQIEVLNRLKQFGECRLITGLRQPKETSDEHIKSTLKSR